MPGTEYIYTIKLQGADALKAAQNFKKQLEAELRNIKFEAKFDTYGITAQMKNVAEQARKQGSMAGGNLTQAMQKSVQRYEREVGRLAPQTFLQPTQDFIEGALDKPSQAAITKLNTLRNAVRQTAESTKKMGVSVDEWAQMSGIERATTALQAAQRQVWGVRGMGYQFESYGRGLMMGGAAMIGGMAAAAKEYVQYAEPMNRAARNLELNAEMTELLDQKLTQLAGTVSYFDPQEQAQQLYLWAAATGEVVESTGELDAALQRTNTVQKLALLGMVDQGVAVEAVTDIMSQYQMSVADTENIVATLVKVAAVSKAEVGDLAMAFTYAGARSHQANTSFEETASALQILAAFGLRGSRAGRGIARLFENLIAPSQEAKKHMDALFKETFGRTDVLINAQGQFVGLAGAVTILAQATENLTEAERAEFVARITTENAARVLIPLLNTEIEARERGISAIAAQTDILVGQRTAQADIYAEMMKDIQGFEVSTASSLDTLNDYWNQYTESIDGQVKKATASIKGSFLIIGREAAKNLVPILQWVAEEARKITTLVEAHPWVMDAVLAAGGIAIAVGVLATAIGKGMRLYADVKAIAMASAMKAAADKNMGAAVSFATSAGMIEAASLNMMRAAATMIGAMSKAEAKKFIEAGGAGAGMAMGGGAAAAQAGKIPLGPALAGLAGKLAITGIVSAIAGGAIWKGVFGEDFMDSWETATEELEAKRLGELEASQATTDEIENRIGALQREADQIREWQKARFFGFGQWGEMPEEYFRMGMPSGTVIQEELAKTEAERGAWEAELEARKRAEQAEGYRLYNQAREYAKRYESEQEQLALYQRRVAMRPGPGRAAMARYYGADPTAALQQYLSIAKVFKQGAEEIDEYIAANIDSLDEEVVALYELAEALGVAATEYGAFIMKGGEVAVAPEFQVDALEQAVMLASGVGRQATEMQMAEELGRLAATSFSQFENLAGLLGDDKIFALHDEYLNDLTATYQAARTMDDRERALALAGFKLDWAERLQVIQETLEEASGLADRISQEAWQPVLGMVGLISEAEALNIYEDFQAELAQVYEETKGLDTELREWRIAEKKYELQERLDLTRDAIEEEERLERESIKDREKWWKDAQSGFRKMVSDALKPTAVTAEDLWATEIGIYKPKWDEPARRMRAAMAGSDEWKNLIPADLWGDEEARAQWGENWLDDFYAGLMPDAVNWGAFVADFTKNLQREAGKEKLIDRAIEELAKEGITATREDVLVAMGLESPFQKSYFGGLSPSEAGKQLSSSVGTALTNVSFEEDAAAAPANEFAKQMTLGMDSYWAEQPWTFKVAGHFAKHVGENYTSLESVGKIIGRHILSGIETSVAGASIVEAITASIMAELADLIGQQLPEGAK